MMLNSPLGSDSGRRNLCPATPRLGDRLRERVDRQCRRMRIALIAPIVGDDRVGGRLLMRAIRSAQLTDILLPAEAWSFISVVG
jgi:hypothetical protein